MRLTNEHKELGDTVKKFSETEILPFIDEWEKAGVFPAHQVFKKMGDLGLLGITKDSKYGGLGLDYSYGVVLSENLGYSESMGVVTAIGVQTDMATPALARFGSEELKKEFLVPSITGEYVSSIAVSEPGAGSDVASIKTYAKEDGDDYIINGQKMWITNSTQADYFCTLVNTGEGHHHKNKSLIIIPSKLPGISVGGRIDKLGLRCSDTAPIFFDNVRVPKRYRIGHEGEGFTLQMKQFQEERLFVAASLLIFMDKCLEKTVEYCRQRMIFGKSLLDNQVLHFRLAELKTEVESLRALTYRACDQYIKGEDVTFLASMAKLKGGRLIREVSDSCLQYWGGMGFTWNNYVSKIYRDCRLASIGGGADEVMLGIICKGMGTLPKESL